VFHQPDVKVTAVPAWSLVPSPRNYNSSIIDFEGERLMAYRSHRMDQGGRCGVVICDINSKWEGGRNTWMNLPEQVHSVMVHHEDPRLFIFNGRLHLAFTETMFHGNNRPYTCTMKYARLKKVGRGKKAEWQIDRVYWPRYGKNGGSHQEKNWQFFEVRPGVLAVIYKADPHTILELDEDGESVTQVSTAEPESVKWPWGTIRGGTPPIRVGGQWLTVFHSATPYPIPPHWRRYYAGAYMFQAEPPYTITKISQKPILVGSEADGHAHDPRNIDSWKPFVVFPNGLIQEDDFTFFVSYGVNDYMTVIAEHSDFFLGDPTFKNWGPKYFRTSNASKPVRIFVHENKAPEWLRWKPGAIVAGQSEGVLETKDPRVALHLLENENADEISAEEYQKHTKHRR